ncbi:MAG TPA: hypothetical protein DD412_06400 [Holosporales bacterium]|nr:hypothetical protein [Holosporales bacterium]
MKKNNTLLPLFFMCASLLFSSTLKAITTANDEDDLSTLLSPEERALVEKELEKQSKKEKPSQKESDLGKKSSNPYATLLEESGVPTTKDQQSTALKKSKKRRSSYSSPDNFKRYKPGNRRPGDALKSTPSQRAFGG